MKKTDKLLIGIVSGIILLVIVAFVVVLNKPKPTYRPEATPEGVAFNYLFALQENDYERAYGYLSPTITGYPRTSEIFAQDVRNNSYSFGRPSDSFTTLEVESSSITGKRADLRINETTFYESDLFSSDQYTDTFVMTLRQNENGQWKIVDSDEYWVNCWNWDGGC